MAEKTNNQLVFFFSDFGPHGPYTGQVQAVVQQAANIDFIDLLNNAPATNPKHSSYLLEAIYNHLPVKRDYLLAVVDPGVGSNRGLISFKHEEMTFIGPDNGLLSGIVRTHDVHEIQSHVKPEHSISSSFHARDWFAPLLADMIRNKEATFETIHANDIVGFEWPDQLPEIIYIDDYGNLITGIKAETVAQNAVISLKNGKTAKQASTFSSVKTGELFWYQNSMGLLEIAANQASAKEFCTASIGDQIYY